MLFVRGSNPGSLFLGVLVSVVFGAFLFVVVVGSNPLSALRGVGFHVNGKPAKGAAIVLFVRGSTPGSMVFGGFLFPWCLRVFSFCGRRPGFCWVSFFYKKNPRPIPQNGLPNTKKGTAPLHFFFIPRRGPNFFIPGSEPFLYHARHFPIPQTEYTRNSTF